MQPLLLICALLTLLSMSAGIYLSRQPQLNQTRLSQALIASAFPSRVIISVCFQATASVILLALGLDALSFSQSFSLLMFISLNQGLAGIWLLWHQWRFGHEGYYHGHSVAQSVGDSVGISHSHSNHNSARVNGGIVKLISVCCLISAGVILWVLLQA